MELNKLAAELHEAAVKKGFWDVDNAVEKHIAKMHSELSEAVQADRADIMYEIERDGAKPEGVVAELADFVMMLLDWAKARDEVIADPDEIFTGKSLAESNAAELPHLVNNLHEGIMLISNDWVSRADLHFAFMPYIVEGWLAHRGYDLWEAIRLKMEYNQKSRAYLHGRKY